MTKEEHFIEYQLKKLRKEIEEKIASFTIRVNYLNDIKHRIDTMPMPETPEELDENYKMLLGFYKTICPLSTIDMDWTYECKIDEIPEELKKFLFDDEEEEGENHDEVETDD